MIKTRRQEVGGARRGSEKMVSRSACEPAKDSTELSPNKSSS